MLTYVLEIWRKDILPNASVKLSKLNEKHLIKQAHQNLKNTYGRHTLSLI